MLPYLMLFAAVIVAAAIGSLWTLWVVHVTRTGTHPMPPIPNPIRWLKRKPDDDNDEPNRKPNRGPTIGP